MSKILFNSLLILLFICAIFILVSKKEAKENQTKYVRIGQILIKVEIVDTILKRNRGLGGRISLGDNEGMLFIFPKAAKYHFWMKKMNFPLDIIWLRDKEIVDIRENLGPETFPQSFAPKAPANYVLEVKAGFSEENDIKIGQMVEHLDCQK